MRKKILFIFNMYAGKGKIKTKLSDILNIFTENGYEVTAYPTQFSGEAIGRIEKMESIYECVVCSGGDGTLDEVVSGMMHRAKERRVPIGYIPAGSTNDFARSLGLPQKMEDAAQKIMDGGRFACDIGVFNKEYFVYVAAFGLFTNVTYLTDQHMKNVLGHVAYILEGVKRLGEIKSYPMTIRSEEKEISGNFMFGMITNSTSVGGFKNITGKNVVLDDGYFETTFIRVPKSISELQEMATAFLKGERDDHYVYTFRTKRLEIISEENIPWTLDGEYGGEHKNVLIENRMQALDFIV